MIKKIIASFFVSALAIGGVATSADAAPASKSERGIDWYTPGK